VKVGTVVLKKEFVVQELRSWSVARALSFDLGALS